MSQISQRRRPTVRGSFATRLGIACLMVGSAFVLMSAPAMACAVTDLTCLPETTASPVTAVTDTTSAVDQAAAAAEKTAAGVADQANKAVKPVTDAVTGILGQTQDPPDPTGILPDVLGSTVAQPSGPGAAEPGGNGPATGSGEVKSRTIRGGAGPSSFGRGPVIGPVAAPISLTPAVSRTIPRGGLFDRIGSLAIQAAEALAFPLALAAIVLLFVAVQNRIDRKDPKLALAPITPDLLRFE
jgi:hypothetical protein